MLMFILYNRYMDLVEIINLLLLDVSDQFSDYALLLLRLVIAFVFFASFKNKVANIRKFAKTNDIPVPLAFVTIFVELAGAISLSLGILPQLGALALMGLMTGTISLHVFKWKSPYWASKGGWEYDLMIFSACAVILTVGGGALALIPVL